MDGWIGGWVVGWLDGWVGRWVGGWLDELILVTHGNFISLGCFTKKEVQC